MTVEKGPREKCSGVFHFLWPKHVFRNEIHGHFTEVYGDDLMGMQNIRKLYRELENYRTSLMVTHQGHM